MMGGMEEGRMRGRDDWRNGRREDERKEMIGGMEEGRMGGRDDGRNGRRQRGRKWKGGIEGRKKGE